MRYCFLFMLCSLFLVSCQKEINVNLPDYEKKLVIEGSIENDDFPMVMISRSVPYFAPLNLDSFIRNVVIADAIVTVSSSTGESEQLEFTFTDKSPYGIAYVGKTLKGETGKMYNLKVEWQNKVYTATTSIVQPFELDSIWFAFDSPQDTTPPIRVLMTDDGSMRNYYRFLVKVHGKRLTDRLWVSTLPVAFDDATFNGLTFNFEILRANPSLIFMPTMTDEERREFYRMTFRPGDTVYVKHSAIDARCFQFWKTIGSEIAFGQNPFGTPTPVISNISGENVLGVWGGYASRYDTLIFNK